MTEQAAVIELGYVGVEASNLDEWSDFAANVLRVEIARRDQDGSLYLRIDERSHRYAIHPGSSNDISYFGMQVRNVGELAAMGRKLTEAGFAVTRGSEALDKQRCVFDLIQVTDPNDLVCEIFCGPQINPVPFHPARPMSGKFVTGSLGAGHLALMVDDIKESLRFYCDILGCGITDYWDIETMTPGMGYACFLHCNGRHHSLLLAQAPPHNGRLEHWMMEVAEIDDLGRVQDEVEARQIPIKRTLGRHNNDHVVSVYFPSPSGFNIEIGWDGLVIDPATWSVNLHPPLEIWGHHFDALPGPSN